MDLKKWFIKKSIGIKHIAWYMHIVNVFELTNKLLYFFAGSAGFFSKNSTL